MPLLVFVLVKFVLIAKTIFFAVFAAKRAYMTIKLYINEQGIFVFLKCERMLFLPEKRIDGVEESGELCLL